MKYRFRIGAIAAAWKGLFSRFSFVETDNYRMVLKEKNVPVVDDEFNFLQESLLYQLRGSLQSLLGDGSPDDGFKITESDPNDNDFGISAGNIFIDGWWINLPSALLYSTQDGHTDTPPALTTPTGNRTDEVYLEFWFEEFTEDDDADIPDPTLSQRTSGRLKLLWKLKVAEGSTTPASGTTGDIYYWRYKVATLSRLDATTDITIAMIADNRTERVILTKDASQTLTNKTLTTPRINTPKINEDVTTDITSTELETLSDGSNADALHTHANLETIPAGTKMLFYQANAPTGWTKDTNSQLHRKAIRVVTDTSGGSYVNQSRNIDDSSVGGHALSVTEIPSHWHYIAGPTITGAPNGGITLSGYTYGGDTADDPSYKYGSYSTGGGATHTHDLKISYMNVIVASKDA